MKKYLLFIVEGNNDKREIQAIIRASLGNAFFENYVDAYHVHGGDITTENDSSEKSIVGKLNKIILSWRNGGEQPFQRIAPSDVKKIIHIVDTDDVFIPEDAIIEADVGKTQYQDKMIQCYDRNMIVGRNRKKTRVLRRMMQIKQIDNIPYVLLFASCNMDHLLFNQRNPLPNTKGQNSFAIATKCKNKTDLQETIYSPGICSLGSIEESWSTIQLDYNSLGRHTNMNIILDVLGSDL